ncbi:flagellar export chaperone FlgN [Colwellia sp. MEBiC06753]
MTPSTSQQLLAKQLEQLHALEALLIQEKEVLQQHSPAALIELTNQKEALLLAIEKFDNTIGNNQQFIQDKKQGLIEQPLAEVQAALAKCQELNLVNGQIINHSQLAVERMKTTLLERHSKSSMTYDNKGKKSAGLSSLDIKA